MIYQTEEWNFELLLTNGADIHNYTNIQSSALHFATKSASLNIGQPRHKLVGQVLDRKDVFTYLGVEVSCKGLYRMNHAKKRIEKAEAAVKSLQPLVQVLGVYQPVLWSSHTSPLYGRVWNMGSRYSQIILEHCKHWTDPNGESSSNGFDYHRSRMRIF